MRMRKFVLFFALLVSIFLLTGVSAEKIWNFNNHSLNVSDNLYTNGNAFGLAKNTAGAHMFRLSGDVYTFENDGGYYGWQIITNANRLTSRGNTARSAYFADTGGDFMMVPAMGTDVRILRDLNVTNGDLYVNGTIYGSVSGSVTDNWINESGDVMTGDLNMSGNNVNNITSISFVHGNNHKIYSSSSGLFFDGGDGVADLLIYDNSIYTDIIRTGYSGNSLITTYDVNETLTLDPNSEGRTDVIGDLNVTGTIYGDLDGGSGGDSLWNESGSSIYPYNLSKKIGIGLDNPSYALELRPESGEENTLNIQSYSAEKLFEITGNPNNPNLLIQMGDIESVDNGQIFILNQSSENFNFLNGNVGIGTSSPSQKLTVDSGNMLFTGNNNNILAVNGDDTSNTPMVVVGEQQNYGVGFRWNSVRDLDIVGYDNSNIFSTSGVTMGKFITTSGMTASDGVFYWAGNLGIGTTTPDEKLYVNGSVHLPDGESLWIGVNEDYLGPKLRLHHAPSTSDAYIDYDVELHFRPNTSSVNEILFDGNGNINLSADKDICIDGGVCLSEAGSGGDADTLDSLDSLQFLRSDQADTFTGTLTASGTAGSDMLIMGNTDIAGVNQIQIADPGEGILYEGGSSGTISTYVHDDATDNIFRVYGNSANNLEMDLYNAGTGTFNLDVEGDISGSGSFYYGDSKEIIDYSDSWLRLNQNGDFTSGIHTPSSLDIHGSIYDGDGDLTLADTVYINNNVGIGTTPGGSRLTVTRTAGTGLSYGIYSSITGLGGKIPVAIAGIAVESPTVGTGRAVGVYGQAGGTTHGWNYGVHGELVSAQEGAAIYGSVGTGQTDIPGQYAGYFLGDVGVTGEIKVNGSVGSGLKFTTDGVVSSDHMFTTRGGSSWVYLRNWADNGYQDMALGTLYAADAVGIGISGPSYALEVDGTIHGTSNLFLGPGAYIDDDLTAGGNADDWIRFNGYIELKSNTDSYGIVLRDKDTTSYMGITQVGGYSYLADSVAYSSYFLRGDADDVYIPDNLVVGDDISADNYLYNSDEKLKMDVKKIDSALEDIKKLEGIEFKWKDNGEKSYGLIAQKVEKVYPELVKTQSVFDEETNETETYKAVQYGNLVAPLIESVKELDEKDSDLELEIRNLEVEIEEQDERIDEQDERIDELEKELDELKKLILNGQKDLLN